MCGIAGVVGARPDPVLLSAMADALRHRGPDEAGEFIGDGAGIVMRRLAIVDVVDGHQPYRNEDGSVVAVFNGEIYGHRPLRERLARRGHEFGSNADGEVIPHAYEEHGADFARALDGMFAVALWDRGRGRLILTRDRTGKKPLHYAVLADGSLAFASELQALLCHRGIERSIDRAALSQYLRYGYVPAPHSAFAGVHTLEPGCVLTWDLDRGTEVHRYWDLEYGPKHSISYGDALDEFEERAGEAVRKRLMSDVPLGAFLSGGVDSSYVVAKMVEHGGRVRTFSIGFDDAAYDERGPAAAVAAHFGTEHHAQCVTAGDLLSVLPMLVRHFGEPFADSSAVPTFYLARLAAEHITVALTGDGGDELMGGYDRHVAAMAAGSFDRLPSGVRRPLVGLATSMARPDADPKGRRQKAHRFARSLELDPDERFADWVGVLTAGQREQLAPGLPAAGAFRPRVVPAAALDRALAIDTASYLPDDLLVKVDIATMASSVEARAPLIDHTLLEWVARLPTGHKVRRGRRKRLLRDALARHAPLALFDRPKMGFAAPVPDWLRGPLAPLLADSLLGHTSRSRGLTDPAVVETMIREHRDRETDHSGALWALLMLELWHREFIDDP